MNIFNDQGQYKNNKLPPHNGNVSRTLEKRETDLFFGLCPLQAGASQEEEIKLIRDCFLYTPLYGTITLLTPLTTHD